ncbi:MAG: tetratricopeptide repeat protein [Alphaproteobacteria bacterium]
MPGKRRSERRLAAIMAVDMVGYSRQMAADEEGTLDLLRKTRSETVDPQVHAHNGRIVKEIGDGLLVEFASAVDAVRCAVGIQEALAMDSERRQDSPRFRIGVNVGDVIADGEDIFGDGVNVAARIESLADPGGVCISSSAHEQVLGKVPVGFADLGEKRLKNIDRPVRVYSIALESVQADTEPAKARLQLPDKPSIAVLPFADMSGDRDQEYFADGITEDIITELSRFRSLFVIARNSSFTYKHRNVKVQDIACDLGVAYVVEGSVRRAGDRVRVTAQLIDGATGHHLWADRYDRDLGDIFAVQDDLVNTLVATIAGRVKTMSIDRVTRKRRENLDAYDYLLRGQAVIWDTRERNLEARAHFEKAIELDPTCARAYSGLGATHMTDWYSGWGESADGSFEQAFKAAQRAVALDETDSLAHARLASQYVQRGDYVQAESHLERALHCNPNDADALAHFSGFLTYAGRPDEAIDRARLAIRLNPYHPYWYLWTLGHAMHDAGRYADAVPSLTRAVDRYPNFVTPRRHLAAIFVRMDRMGEARRQAEEILRLEPDYSLSRLSARLPYQDPVARDYYLDGLRQAGLPD